MKSTHKAFVVPIKLEKHPDADSLSIVSVKGWTVVVRTEDWLNRKLGVFVQPDSLVPDTDTFAFLFNKLYEAKVDGQRHRASARSIEAATEIFKAEGLDVTEDDVTRVMSNPQYALTPDETAVKKDDGEYARITVRKFRGIKSYGLLIPAPEDAVEGSDVAEVFGIKHYEPALTSTRGENERGPLGVNAPVYDVDALKNYEDIFQPGEPTSISEKIHGASAKYIFGKDSEGNSRMFCGSHYNWKKDDPASIWWKGLRSHPEIEAFCRENPDIIVYGEVYGQVQKGFEYGKNAGEVGILVFDLYRLPKEGEPRGEWIDIDTARKIGHNLPWVPLIAHDIPFNIEEIMEMAEGETTIEGARDGHIREGVVVRPMVEREDPELGRVCLKIVGFGYLEGKKAKKKKK